MTMIARKHLLKLFGAALFLLYFLWFCFPGEYVMIANMDQHLFYTTTDHFMSFTSRPGGILEYAGQFLTQFYRFRMAGAMVIALLITSGFFVTARLIKTIPGQKGIMVFAIITPTRSIIHSVLSWLSCSPGSFLFIPVKEGFSW